MLCYWIEFVFVVPVSVLFGLALAEAVDILEGGSYGQVEN